MSKAKRNGFTILLAAALSFIFAAFLCLGFPMAEVRAEEKTVTGAAEFLVAMAYGKSGDTVKLGAGITVDLTDEDFVGEVYPGNPDPNKDLVLKAEEGTSLDLTVDLNGNTLEIITGSDKSCLTLIGEVALKVVDTSADGDGKVIGHSNGNLFYGDANSALTLESVDVEFTAADNITVAKPAIYTEGSVSLSDVNYASSNAAEASLIDAESLADGTYVYSDGSNYYVGGEEILAQTGVVAAIEQTNEAYTSLQEAIDEASAGSTVTLIADAVCEDDGLIQSNGGCFISVPADKDITLDLNGKAIKVIPQESSGAYRDYTVLYNTGTLTIADSSSEKTGTMLVDDKSVSRIILNIIANAGTLNIEGGNYNGQCPFANGGTLNIYSGNFFNTRDASETIAIACAEGTINILKNDKGLPEPVFTNVAFTYANEIETSAVINIECGTIIGADAQQIDPDLTMDKVFLAFYYGDYANQNLQFNVTGGTFEGGIVLGDNLSSAPESEDIQFSGGTFSEPVPAEYLAEGFTLAADGDGFSVLTEETVADYMAYITGEDGTAIYYETLQEAVEAAVAGDTIVLAKDIEATGSVINTTLDAQITIDLNGHTIKSSNQNTAVFTIRTTKNLTITSSQEGGAIEAAYALLLRPKESGITITVENIAFSGRISFYSPIQITRLSTAEAKAVLSNVTVDYDHAAGSARTAAIYVSDIAELEINDSTIEVTDAATNRDTEFYAVELNATTAEFYGGSIAAEGDLSRAIHSHNRGQTPSVVTLNGTTVSGQDRAIYSYYSTLTLNGATVSAVNNAAVHGEGSGITIDGGSISSEKGPGIVFLGGIVLEEAADLLAADNTASFKTLELGGGVTVTGDTFAVSGNGSAKENQPYSGTIINVRDASLTGNIGHGVYQPQVGILNVYDGAVISGASGIEIRAGELYVSGGTITGTRSELVISDAAAGGGGGTSIDGAAIAISQHSTNKPVFVSITGGNLTGPAALYEEDVLNETANDTINAAVSGGTFTSTQEGMASVFSENMEGFVSGGIFGEALPAEYLAEDCAQIASGETFTVGTEKNLAAAQNAVAVVEGTGIAYTNLQEAINNASDGDTIKLLQSITVDTAAANHPEGRTDVGLYILQKNLTINGNGKTIQSSSVPRILNVIGDYDADGTADCDLFTVTLRNLTIISTGNSFRPLETVGGNITLNLEKVVLDNTGSSGSNNIVFTAGGNSTCGSSALPVNVNISGSTLTAMATGFAFKSFNPVTLTIKDSELSGYGALWFDGQHSSFGSRGSVVTVENSTLTATNSFSGKSDFAAVVLDDSNIEVTLTDSVVNIIANGASKQATVMYGADDSSLAVKGSSTVLLSGSNALHSMYRSGTVSDLSSIVYTLGAGVKTNVLTADVADNSVIYYDEAQEVYVVVEEENAAGAGVVALNGVVGYTSLQSAIGMAEAGDTVTLLQDRTESITVVEGQEIVLDLGGNTLTGSDLKAIANAGTLTVKNGEVIGKTSAIFNGANSLDGDVTTQLHSATLTLENVRLSSTNTTAGVTLNNSFSTILSIKGSTITAQPGMTALNNSGWIGEITDTAITVEDSSGLFGGSGIAIVLGGNVYCEGSGVIKEVSGCTITGEIRVAANGEDQTGSIVITGGTLDVSFICGDGYYSLATESGYAAGKGSFVAEAGAVAVNEGTGIAYTNLQEAINNASDGDTIMLIQNVTLEGERIEIGDINNAAAKAREITFDLNGQTLFIGNVAYDYGGADENFNTAALYLGYNTTLNIIDGSEDGTGAIDAQNADDLTVPVGAMRAGSVLNISGGTITVDTPNESCVFAANGGKINISGGTFTNLSEEEYAWGGGDPLVVNVDNNTSDYTDLVITGGTFNGRNPALGDDNMGGYFVDENVVTGYDGESGSYTVYEDADAAAAAGADAVYTVEDDGVVAIVYSAAGFNEAMNGTYDVIRLGKDFTFTNYVVIRRSMTFDLGGYTLGATTGTVLYAIGPAEGESNSIRVINGTIESSRDAGTAVVVYGNADVQFENITIDSQYSDGSRGMQVGIVAEGYEACITKVTLVDTEINAKEVGVFVCGTTDESNPITLIAHDSRINATVFGICGNGSEGYQNTCIELYDTYVKADSGNAATEDWDNMGLGIYHLQKGTLLIDGGSVTGVASAIEIRSGSLAVQGGAVLTATAEKFHITPNPSGTTTVGAAVAVSQHTTNNPIQVNISDAVLNGVYALYEDDVQDPAVGDVAVTVTGGTYNGGVHSENVAAFITGGTFSEMPLFSYFEEGYVAAWNEDVQMYVTEEGSWVASINERAYASLEDAINAAKDGDTVTLLSDITISETLTIDNAIALDLNDCTITSAADVAVRITADATLEGGTLIAADGAQAVTVDGAVVEFNKMSVTGGAPEATENLYFIEITNGSDVTFDGSTVTFTYAYAESVNPDAPPQGQVIRSLASDLTIVNSTITSGDYGVTFRGSMTDEEAVAADASEYKTLTITDSTVQARLFAVSGNGSGTNHGTNIAVTGSSKLESTKAQAIYHPQYGTLNISLADDETQVYIKGTAGIEMRAGSLTVESGYIEATGEFASGPQGGGSTTDGAAIAIVQHTTQLPISVELNGGEYVGDYAVYEYNQQGNPDEAIEDISLSVTGGTYEGDLSSQNLTGFISGGKFAVQPADDYFDENYAPQFYDGYFIVVKSTALAEAKYAAQTDIRMYAVQLGIDWSALADDESEAAKALVAAYDAIEEATSTLGVAKAKAAAFEAADAYAKAVKEEFEKYKADKLGELAAALAGEDGTEDDVVLPTATWFALNNAETKAEFDEYLDNALAEAEAIRAYRTAIAEQTAQLTDLAETLASFESNMGVEFGQLLTDIQGALEEAQAAIVGGDGSDSLASIQDYLENTIKITLDSISGTLNTVAGDVASVKTTLENLDVSAELKDEFDALAKAIADAQAAINSNTGTELDAAIEDSIRLRQTPSRA